MSFKTLALSCLALAPLGVYGGACKPRSTDSVIISSSQITVSSEISQSTQITSIVSSEEKTATSSEVTQSIEPTITVSSDLETTISSEAPSTTTSSAPCPAWTPKNPYPANNVCAKPLYYDHSTGPSYLTSTLKANINECAKFCGDTPQCVSFYAEDYVPGPGAPTYKICFLFKGYYQDISGFSQRGDDQPTYWEQGCFECVRDPPAPVVS
ncbi:hypothetical protein FSPOR_8072 [Fusarium sporotrichioides]|uniref:Apple domain-containing protein n=1 Tax=Fusarium sporotrichioides TaxID=5514 RepID=A0A395RWN1_FUSSP|nr:hypothetical protein FSPOR_8072 [Fusarium sporotrichioides]